MRFRESLAILLMPVVFATIAASWLTVQALQSQFEKDQLNRIEQVHSEARFFADHIADEFEALKKGVIHPSGGVKGVLHWAELEADVQGVRGVRRTASSPTPWQPRPDFESEYLQFVTKNIDLTELRQNKIATLRVKQDPMRTQEWLAFAFSLPSQNIVVALVDPVQAFSAFKRLENRGEGGRLRAFIASADGHVFAHSQKNYTGADFSGLDVFSGTRDHGGRAYVGVDRVPVVAGYVRLTSLPLMIVVERLEQDSPVVTFGFGAIFKRFAGQILAASGLIFLMMILAAWWVSRRSQSIRKKTLAQQTVRQQTAFKPSVTASPQYSKDMFIVSNPQRASTNVQTKNKPRLPQ